MTIHMIQFFFKLNVCRRCFSSSSKYSQHIISDYNFVLGLQNILCPQTLLDGYCSVRIINLLLG